MKHFITFAAITLWITAYTQYCPALGPDQLLPCGVSSTTLTADFSQCAPGSNPNSTTNYVSTNIPYAAQTNTGTQLFMSDDSQQGPFNIGFTFCFYGQTYTQFWVGSNGWISFSPGQPTTFTSAAIPNAGFNIPKNCVMGPWQDWHPGVGGQIRYQVQGTAPCRRLVVSWINVPMFQCTGTTGTFHIVLYESTNVIENHIQSKQFCAWAGGTAVQGVHNATGTAAVTIPGRNSTQWLANNDAWRYTPAGPAVTPIPTWYQVGVAAPIGTGNSITVTPPVAGASYTCHLQYPTCNAGWSACNGGASNTPDTVFVLPGTAIPTVSSITALDTVCWQATAAVYQVTPQPGVTFIWDAIGVIAAGQGTDNITVDWTGFAPGFIPGAVMVTPELNGCVGLPETVDVYILNIDPVIPTQPALCEYDDVVTLSANPAGGIFTGTGVSGNQFDPGTAVGNNVITYTYQQSGCVFDTVSQITVYPTPILDTIAPFNPFYELCETDSVIITWAAPATPAGGVWEWEWQSQQVETETLTQSVTWAQQGVNVVSVTYYANGCVSDPQMATITITRCPETLIFIPNTFTPNNNEHNQTWKPVFTSGFDPYDLHVEVLNRWGQYVWESHDVNAEWDGTYAGKPCQDGVYFYKVTYGSDIDAGKTVLTGHVTIIR